MIAMLTIIIFAIIVTGCVMFTSPEEDTKFTDIK